MHLQGRWVRTALAVGLQLVASGAVADARQRARELERTVNEELGLVESEVQRLEVAREGATGSAAAPVLVELSVRGEPDLLVLHEADVRAPGFRLHVQDDAGIHTLVDREPPTTYRGQLAGHPGSVVAASLLEDGLYARILPPNGEELWLEPVGDRVAEATPGHHVLYATRNVIVPASLCGSEELESRGWAAPLEEPGPSVASLSSASVTELACDADYEYFARYGSVSAVSNRIQSVINVMNLQYEAAAGITHQITSIVVRTSASQPYTGTHANSLLIQMQNDWNANRSGVARDVAHLFTGKPLTNGVIGSSYVGSICTLDQAYGVSQADYSPTFACTTDLVAHELGHGWGSGHCTCPYTMNAVANCANQFSPATATLLQNARQSLIAYGCIGGGGGPSAIKSFATSDLQTSLGTVTAGSYATTIDQDNVYEVITEEVSGGKRSRRTSRLSHTWTLDVAPGGSHTFFVDAHHTYNSEGDDCRFSYSLDGVGYSPMLTVTRTAGGNSLQSFVFPQDVSGTLYVRVEDTDATPGSSAADALYVDYMFVESDPTGASTPPSAPAGLSVSAASGSIQLDWDDNTEPDLDGYAVYRGTQSGGPYTRLNGALVLASAYTDGSVQSGATYYYVRHGVRHLGSGEPGQPAGVGQRGHDRRRPRRERRALDPRRRSPAATWTRTRTTSSTKRSARPSPRGRRAAATATSNIGGRSRSRAEAPSRSSPRLTTARRPTGTTSCCRTRRTAPPTCPCSP